MTKRMLMMALLVGLGRALLAQVENEGPVVNKGDAMPEFEIKLKDQTISSETFKGKYVLINFFATWCPPCIQELPHLQKKVWEPLKENSNFVLLVIGREHNEEELDKFAKKRKLDLPFYPDQDRSIFSQFAPNTIPRNYLINPDGKVIYAETGYTEKEFSHLVELIIRKVQ